MLLDCGTVDLSDWTGPSCAGEGFAKRAPSPNAPLNTPSARHVSTHPLVTTPTRQPRCAPHHPYKRLHVIPTRPAPATRPPPPHPPKLCLAYREDGGTAVVVLTQREKLEMEEMFRWGWGCRMRGFQQ